MTDKSRLQVLLDPSVAEALDMYCQSLGYKKSSLAARLIREHLEQHSVMDAGQQQLFAIREQKSEYK